MDKPIALMFALSTFFANSIAFAQAPDSAALLTAQRDALAAFSRMDGVWRGHA